MRYWTDEQHQRILTICDHRRVARLWLFGSATTDKFDPAQSDFDFLVEMLPDDDGERLGENVWELWNELEELLGRRVDLLTAKYIHNPYLWASIERSRQLLYDRASHEVLV